MTNPADLKVCMIVHQYYYYDGRVRAYAEALVKAGAKVDVLCVSAPRHAAAPPLEGLRVFTIPVSRAYSGPGSYVVEYALALLFYTIRLLALYTRQRYPIIHVHNMPDFLIFAALIPRLLGAKLVLDIHDPTPEFTMSKYSKPATSRLVRAMCWQERLSARLAHAIITANPIFKERLVSRGLPPSAITVIGNEVDTKIFDRQRYEHERLLRDRRFVLIYAGTIAPRYGLDVAVSALPLLVERIPGIRLQIIGKQTTYSEELSARAGQLGVLSHLELVPAIPLDAVPRRLAQADIGIYTAISDPHMDVAVPTKVLEYAFMGLPVVASRLRVLEEGFSPKALLLFEPGRAEEFAQHILALYEHPARRTQLVQEMDRTFVEAQRRQQQQQSYFALLNTLLSAQETRLPVAVGDRVDDAHRRALDD
ncbi:MAG: glycosyltransferase family 4 protein [Anaerolineae bacterium]|nr:glycosyltransferase family 4 protein [Anaerolineae bacterium]